MIIVRILGDSKTEAYKAAQRVVRSLPFCEEYNNHFYCDVAIAPLLRERLSAAQIEDSIHGVLVFHPSPLPYGRGANSIKKAYERKEPITAATWFWANTGKMDSGDLSEQEIVKIDYSLPPREFYKLHMLPAMMRTLSRAMRGLHKGSVRRIPQISAYASFDYKKNTI